MPRRRFLHYVLPSGQLVRLVRWTRNERNEFVVRVSPGGRQRLEFLVSWFDKNAVCIGHMEAQS